MDYVEARKLIESHEYHNGKPLELTKLESYRGYQIGKNKDGFFAANYFNKYKADSIQELKNIIDAEKFVTNVRIHASIHEIKTWDCKQPY